MDFQNNHHIETLLAELRNLNQQAAMERLSGLDDQVLWLLYKSGFEDALVLLFKKYHRQIIVLVYGKLNAKGEVRLELVQDAFGDFLERVLAGQYQAEEIKKNFTAFSVHHLSYLVRSRLRLTANCKMQALDESATNSFSEFRPHLKVEERIDFRKVVDLIPRVSNKVYRKVLWLILILGYSSQDLTEVFGQREKAYDKRSRAIKAFREVLDKEGLLEELR